MARLLIDAAAAALGRPDRGPVRARLARAWELGTDGAALLRRALVLLGDHELNPSTFAIRICAST